MPFLPSPTPSFYTNSRASPSPIAISTVINTIERKKERTVTTPEPFSSLFLVEMTISPSSSRLT